MTAPLLPTDGCPRCVSGVPNHPHRVEFDSDGTGLVAWYRCRHCRNSWWTSWGISALDLPCPGCPACEGAVA